MTKINDLAWQYDEFEQAGTDYSSQAEAEIYDSRHSVFRDMESEAIKILDSLGIRAGDSLIDFGSGSGTFAVLAARLCARVHAVDVSQAMLDIAGAKASRAGLSNISFHHAGFLSYEHTEPPVDAVVTTLALHHLPDFWKGMALKRVHGMLKRGGRLYLHDVIIQEDTAPDNIRMLIEALGKAGGRRLREDIERHFKDEFSTYDWVMEGLLSRAGFTVRSRHMEGGVLGTYLCTRG
jgi:cyclopropane fatty-acyl-phospholipid synthase-like methyltransferase